MWTAVGIVVVTLAGLGGYAVWAASALAAGNSPGFVLAVLPAAYFAVIAAATAFWFTLAWIFRSPRPPDRQLGLRATLRLAWGEYVALATSPARMGGYWWLIRDPAPAPAAMPVLLLHGVVCNAGVFRALIADLRARGIGPVYTLSYGPPLAAAELFVEQLAVRIESIRAATGAARVALVAHSMGGVVARAYIQRYGAARVATLVTIGTPHHGSHHARFAVGASIAALRPDSEWLARLNRDEGAPLPVRVVPIWSWHDSLVTPQTSARLAGAEEIALAGIGHNAMLGDARVFELVADELRRAAGAAARGAPPAGG
jgi:triacylglycerol esterase/lipase EstA (alpha/beta hydrolase family)